jgi:hypothetical protein
MKLKIPATVSNAESWQELQRYVAQSIDAIASLLNGRVGFIDNCQVSYVTVVFPSASTTISVDHTLGVQPTGYIVVGKNAGAHVFDGDTANTTSKLYVQASAAMTARLLVF